MSAKVAAVLTFPGMPVDEMEADCALFTLSLFVDECQQTHSCKSILRDRVYLGEPPNKCTKHGLFILNPGTLLEVEKFVCAKWIRGLGLP